MTKLTTEQQIRIAALNAAVQQYNGVEFDGTEVTLEAARVFENYILGTKKDQVQIFETPGEISYSTTEPADFTHCVIAVGEDGAKHGHEPVQHRDFKEPWCNTCGLNAYLQKPIGSRSKEST